MRPGRKNANAPRYDTAGPDRWAPLPRRRNARMPRIIRVLACVLRTRGACRIAAGPTLRRYRERTGRRQGDASPSPSDSIGAVVNGISRAVKFVFNRFVDRRRVNNSNSGARRICESMAPPPIHQLLNAKHSPNSINIYSRFPAHQGSHVVSFVCSFREYFLHNRLAMLQRRDGARLQLSGSLELRGASRVPVRAVAPAPAPRTARSPLDSLSRGTRRRVFAGADRSTNYGPTKWAPLLLVPRRARLFCMAPRERSDVR